MRSFNRQPVSPNAALVSIVVGGKTFTATTTTDGFLYEAGVAYQFDITINESDVAVSARVINWYPAGPYPINIVEVTTSSADTEGVDMGARMNVYLKDASSEYNPWVTYTYAGNNKWNPDAPVYWSDILTPSVDLRASIVAATKLNDTQMDDILIADDLNVPVGYGADFVLRHVGSKLVIRLESDTFTTADLDGATVTMPQS